jgi:hypothetical protein
MMSRIIAHLNTVLFVDTLALTYPVTPTVPPFCAAKLCVVMSVGSYEIPLPVFFAIVTGTSGDFGLKIGIGVLPLFAPPPPEPIPGGV